MGDPRTSHQYQAQGSGAIRPAQEGVAAAICVLPEGKMNEWVTLRSLADLYREFGSKPALTDPGFNDWWNLYMALKNAMWNNRSYLTLYVWRTAHYTDYTDPSTLTAVAGSYTFPDSDGSNTLKLEDVSARDDVFSGKIVASSLDSSTMFDIEIYVDGSLYEAVRNCNMTVGDVNYAVTRVGTQRRWKAVDLGLGTLPAVTGSAQAFAGGSDGVTGLLYTDLIGTQHATGNTGLYALSEFGPLEKPEHVMIPHKMSSASNERLLMKALELFCYTYGYIPVTRTPEGYDRTEVKEFKSGTGDFAGLGAFGNDIGGSQMVWPWGTPPELMTEKVTGTTLPPRVSAEGAKIGALCRLIGIKGVEEAAAGYTYGDTGFSELERKTNTDDSELLDPIGVQVIRSDLGNIFWGHCTMSTDPVYIDETVRRFDNLDIRAIDHATMPDLHRKGSPTRMRSIERRILAYHRNRFNQHRDFYRYDNFSDAIEVDVVGQNDVESDAYLVEGKLFTRWVTRPARSIHDIIHRYSHEAKRTESGSEA